MKSKSLAVLAVWMLSGVCHAQVRPRPGAKPAEPPAFMKQLSAYDQFGAVTKAVLKNGLTVLVVEAHATPLVEALAWIKVGYRDEPSDQKGISRIIERVLARGTTNRAARVLADDLHALGGEWRSATEYDHTAFRAVVPAVQWKRALELQADILLNPLLDAEEIRAQTEALGFETRRLWLRQGAEARQRLLATGFAGARLDGTLWPGMALPALTKENLSAFHQANYSAGRMLYVICGDVTASEVVGTIVGLYGKMKAAAGDRSRTTDALPADGLRYAQVRSADNTGRVLIGFRTPGAGSPDAPALHVLRAILGVGQASIASRRLKYEKGLVHDAVVEAVTFDDTGYLLLRFDVDPGNIDRCEIAAFTEFEILKKQPPDDTELRRAQAQAQREYWEEMQTVSGRARGYAWHEAAGSWKQFDSYPAKVAQIQWGDIARVASRYLVLRNCAIVESLPEAWEARNVTAEALESTIRDLLAPATAQELEARQSQGKRAWELPALEDTFNPSETRHPFQTASILRGPEVFIREEHTLPLVHAGIFFAGGKLMETPKNSGITSLMLRTMLRDTEKRTAEDVFRQLEAHGGLLSPVVADDYFGVLMSIRSIHAERGLEILNQMIKSPKFDPQEVERQKRFQSADLSDRSLCESARRRITSALFGDHSYALGADGSEAGLAAITPEAVRKWHAELVENRKPKVVIVGDTVGTSLAAYFVRNFSGSRFLDLKVPEGYPKPLERKAEFEEGWAGGTSRVVAGFQAPPEGDEDSYPLMVLTSLAAERIARLPEGLGGGVPGARSASIHYDAAYRGGSVVAAVSTERQDEEQALKRLVDELTGLATATITFREYRVAVNGAIGEFTIGRQDRFRQIMDVVDFLMAGEGIEGYEDYANRLQDVRQADLQEVAKRIFRIDRSVTLRLHGRQHP